MNIKGAEYQVVLDQGRQLVTLVIPYSSVPAFRALFCGALLLYGGGSARAGELKDTMHPLPIDEEELRRLAYQMVSLLPPPFKSQ